MTETVTITQALKPCPVGVRKIETVTGDFLTEPGEPFWRIEIDGFCADFDHEQAANNFADAINTRIDPVVRAERIANRMGATFSPREPDAALVIGKPYSPEGEQDEDGNPIWACEVQIVGGHAVRAIVYGSTEDEALALAHRFIAPDLPRGSGASDEPVEAIKERLREVHRRNPKEYVEVCSIIDAIAALSTPEASDCKIRQEGFGAGVEAAAQSVAQCEGIIRGLLHEPARAETLVDGLQISIRALTKEQADG